MTKRIDFKITITENKHNTYKVVVKTGTTEAVYKELYKEQVFKVVEKFL